MRGVKLYYPGITVLLAVASLMLLAPGADAAIPGLTGTNFTLTAKDGYISTPDGNSVYTWGYANGSAAMQYPGPTLIVEFGAAVIVNLENELSEPVSIVFPGQTGVTAVGGPMSQDGLLTKEALPGGSVAYSFLANAAGTYHYHSGTNPEVQVEMGLVGAIIVRPPGFNPSAPMAYFDPDTEYDHEFLFLLTEMDSRIHERVLFLGSSSLSSTDYLSDYFPNYWFINGRCAPDTMVPNNVPWLRAQPYNCMPRMNPGDKLLLRIIGGGRDEHPFHTHGNHVRIIATDGRMLGDGGIGPGANLSYKVFTVPVHPGQTFDGIFEWTGHGLGWDMYGHKPGDPMEPGEDPNDHGKPIPVALPRQQDLTFGGFYGGSPYLGVLGRLPPGEGGLNPNGGFVYMWHSHAEKEMANYDIFPGGMMTMLIIQAPGIPVD